MAVTEAEAIEVIKKAGWKEWPHKTDYNGPLYWDGSDPKEGGLYAWYAAYREIKAREKEQLQPKLF